MAFALRSPTFRVRDLVRLNAVAAAPLVAVSVPEIYDQLDELDAETFLTDINFPAAARHLAFEVFARSFFARPERLSAAELATMFHIYFLGSSEGLVFDVAESNFDTALWEPLGQYLISQGVRLRTEVSAESVSVGGTRTLQVHDSTGRTVDADGVVLAADTAGLQRIVAASPGLGDDGWRRQVSQLRTAPPFAVQRLWLDQPVDTGRPAFLGTGGLAPSTTSVWSAITKSSPRNGRASIMVRCSGALLFRGRAARGRRVAAAYAGPPVPAVPGDRDGAHRRGDALDSRRLSVVQSGRFRRSADGRHADRWSDAGRRWYSHRPAGGLDGAGSHHRMVGGQPTVVRLGRGRSYVAHRSGGGRSPVLRWLAGREGRAS